MKLNIDAKSRRWRILRGRCLLAASLLAQFLGALPGATASTTIDYNRDIRPIFSENCHVCLGQTDDFGYNIVADPVHAHDFQATALHCLGIDHEKLTYRFQGRDFRLTEIHGQVVKQILA